MDDIMNRVNSLEESVLLIKGFSKRAKNETNEHKREFLNMVIMCHLLGNLFTGKWIKRAGKERIRPGHDFYCRLIL